MSAFSILSLLFVCVISFGSAENPIWLPIDQVSQYSLLPPYGMPHWTLGDDAFALSSTIRIAEDRQSKRGSLWHNFPTNFSSWEVEVEVKIHGVSSVGADGMAFWYTEQNKRTGLLFGNQENFNGLGIAIDTYDNDGSGLHPYVSVMINDGTKLFKHEHEHKGKDNDHGIEINGCQLPIRNQREPTKFLIRYENKRLSVDIVSRMLRTDGGFETMRTRCLPPRSVSLPSGYYFGLTATTGDLADNHDVMSFQVRSLDYTTHLPQEKLFDSEIETSLDGIYFEFFSANRRNFQQVEKKLDALAKRIRGFEGQIANISTAKAPRVRPVVNNGLEQEMRELLNQQKRYVDFVAQQMHTVVEVAQRREQESKKAFDDLVEDLNQLQAALNRNKKSTSASVSGINWLEVVSLLLAIGMVIMGLISSKKFRFFQRKKRY